MRQFLVFLLFLGALAGGWYARDLMPKHVEAEAHEEDHADKPGIEIADGIVKLDEETQERLGISVTPLPVADRTPFVRAIGSVLDPAPLIALESEIAIAKAAMNASRAEFEREQKGSENIAKKIVEAASVQARADELKVTTLMRRLPLEWGDMTAKLDAPALSQLCEKLARGAAGIARVDVIDGVSAATLPESAVVRALADEAKVITTTRIHSAPSVDSRTQSAAFLLLCDYAEGNLLPPGTAITAELRSMGEAKKGVLVPRGAIVRQGPQAWVYIEKEEREFARVPVALDTREEEGWFITSEAVPVGGKLVTTGAAALLSAELTAAGAGGGEEEP